MRAVFVSALLWAALALPAAAKAPVVVELFTSQGCEACAASGELVAELVQRDDVLPLTFSVPYWDYLGWRDTFAKPVFADRQKTYVRRLTRKAAYTPQIVVDGHAQASASDREAVERLIAEAGKARRNPPDMLFQEGGRVAVGSGPAPSGGAEVWLVRYDPRLQHVEVTRGENRGRTIAYRNVVRQLVRLGAWQGRPKVYRLPKAPSEDLETVVLVQQSGGGRVLALLTD